MNDESMSEEDELVSALIDSYGKKDNIYEYEFEPEAHYNHFGDRGVADLCKREVEELSGGRKYTGERVYEVKSASAVKKSSGANEILRQFHRMRKYFYMDESRSIPDYASFELCFVPSKTTVKHVAENINIYQASREKLLSAADLEYSFAGREAYILFRGTDPFGSVPAGIMSKKHNVTDGTSWKEALSNMSDEPNIVEVRSILEKLGY